MGATTARLGLLAEVSEDPWNLGDSRWTATLGPVKAHGRTKTAALKALAEEVVHGLSRLDAEPAFARDDDGSLIAAVPRWHGVEHYRVTEEGVRSTAACDGPPAKSLEGTHHYTVIPQR
ncbi:hypothetical protein [Streptomyces sp. NRRL S-455]|uniref:hypothetical protein n=1 Tax=Streptomyces sp. NRRL S-455 TaxID=1463908 RepID=UPI0004C1F732|nr:hypothetical protein [Streptomyces sp. NRRL S-455]